MATSRTIRNGLSCRQSRRFLNAAPDEVANAGVQWELNQVVLCWSPMAHASCHDRIDWDQDVPGKADVLCQLLQHVP